MNCPLLTLKLTKAKRMSIYKKALECLEENEIPGKIEGELCLLLPIILWNLDHYLDDSPDGRCWYYENTSKAFPEIAEWIPEINKSKNRMETRILALKTILEK